MQANKINAFRCYYYYYYYYYYYFAANITGHMTS